MINYSYLICSNTMKINANIEMKKLMIKMNSNNAKNIK